MKFAHCKQYISVHSPVEFYNAGPNEQNQHFKEL